MILDAVELNNRNLQRMAGMRDNKVYIGPEIVTLVFVNACNLRCHFCIQDHAPGNPAHLEKANYLQWEKFLGIIRDCVDLKVDQIEISGGEPAIHPEFRRMMGHLKEQPLKVKLYTNATFPVDYCLDVIKGDHVIINLSAADRQQYLELKEKDFFDRVIANIKRLVFLRDSEKPEFYIELYFIVNSKNISQKQKIHDLAMEWGVNSIQFIDMHVHEYNKHISFPESHSSAPMGEVKKTPPVCANGWFNTVINLNGNVSTCCRIIKMHSVDFNKSGFKQFWLSSRMKYLRLLGKRGYIQKMFKACQTCPWYDKNMERSKALSKM